MKRILMLVLAMMLVSSIGFAANSKSAGSTTQGRFVQVSVDTDPGGTGYSSDAVCNKNVLGLYVDTVRACITSIGTGAELTLQWSLDNITWYDYEDSPYTTAPQRFVIEDVSAGVYYRWHVKDNKQGSGGSSVGRIDW